jgi:mono/diheme cytochrome c family protein
MKDNGVTRSTSLLLWVVIVWSLAAPAETAFAQEQDKAKIAKGEQTFSEYCSTCHGDNLISSGQIPDLRRLKATDRSRFESTVINGKNQMPPWKGALNEQQIETIWSYIRANAFEK